jgi:hypothetical protein
MSSNCQPASGTVFELKPKVPCPSGYGGIKVVLMPNGSIYNYFSDNNKFSWYDAVNESNKLSPMCP